MMLYPATAERLFQDKSFRYVILRGKPCQITQMIKNKDNKILFIGVDVTTQSKYYLTVRADTIMNAFVVLRQEFRLLSIENDVFHLQGTNKNYMESVIVDEWDLCGLYSVANYSEENLKIYSVANLKICYEPQNKLHRDLVKIYSDDSITLVNVDLAPKQINGKYSNLGYYPMITSFR